MIYEHQMKRYQEEAELKHQNTRKSKGDEHFETPTENTSSNDTDSRKNSNLLLDRIRELLSSKTKEQSHEDEKHFRFNPLVLVASFLAFLSFIFNKSRDHLDERHVPTVPFQRQMSLNFLSQDENLKYYLHLENRFPTPSGISSKRTSLQTSSSKRLEHGFYNYMEKFYPPTRGSPLEPIEEEEYTAMSLVTENLQEQDEKQALEQARQIIHAVLGNIKQTESTEQRRQWTAILLDDQDPFTSIEDESKPRLVN